MSKRSFRVGLLAAVLLAQALPRQIPTVCGTHREKGREQIFLHRVSERSRLRGTGQLLQAQPRPRAQVVGHIAVLEDAGDIVLRPNPFNLGDRTLSFQPGDTSATRYRFQVGANTYDAGAASSGAPLAGLDDDDARLVPLPFAFPFYGESYTQLFVNSDGNLTFGESDTASTDRSLGRVTHGPPRIAALFRDLDPSRAPSSVRVLAESRRFVVSWVAVPEYRESGMGPTQTFQIRLFPDGRIEFAYATITTREAVVGISPGRRRGTTSLVTFLSGSANEFTGTVAEVFRAGSSQIDIVAAARRFYETHEDAYDYLVIFNNVGIPAAAGAVAYQVTVRNRQRGIGAEIVDYGAVFGSSSRLQAVINMGPLEQYPGDPYAPIPGRGAVTGDTPMTVLGHEAGHLFLAFVSYRDPNNPTARPMLGAQQAHWSFFFNSDASLLEGNRIRDNGPQASPRFTTVATVEGFSPLDQYLMGLRAPEEVHPPHELFVVTNPTANRTASSLPEPGLSFNGNRRNTSIEEIIQAEGRRTPDHTVSQRRFRFAFILVTAQGSQPSQFELDKLERFRQEFETFYRRATSDRAWAETTLKRSLKLSVFPAAGALVGVERPVTLSLERPAASALPIALRTTGGLLRVPASVTIPAGETSVSFPITGLAAGVAELMAEPADATYETAHARIQVRNAVSELKLLVVSGDRQASVPGNPLQPIVLRVVDINELPYPGVRVQAIVSGGGTVSPSTAVTDGDGLVQFVWTTGATGAQRLTAVLEGAPHSAVTVTALTPPAFEAGGVVNSASFQAELAPGSFASIFGSGLAGGATAVASPPYPTTLAGVQVLVNRTAARLQFVSDYQINFLVPENVPTGAATLSVSTPIGTSATVQVPVVPAAPGIFVLDPVTNFGAILISGTGLTTVQRPARRGEFLEIYATGLGVTQASSRFPGFRETALTPAVFIGGVRLEDPAFSGLSPQFPGLYQVNVRVGANAPAGEQLLWLEMGGRRSNQVKVRIE
ncbi:MAG: hypothetical protein RMK57_06835 [Bryobacterales bacterium]|nr:hypothetical protein [Bryobacteraceae bacterium]MDW8354229.1 hypothetical protein [Bryobacterales bacterium]